MISLESVVRLAKQHPELVEDLNRRLAEHVKNKGIPGKKPSRALGSVDMEPLHWSSCEGCEAGAGTP